MKSIQFYTISFIEGACLMSFQLIISRVIANGYGVTLTVWASIIAFTLLGLALGYFTGGYFAKVSKKNYRILFFLLLLSSASSILFALLGDLSINKFMSFSPVIGLLFFCLCIIVPVIFFSAL